MLCTAGLSGPIPLNNGMLNIIGNISLSTNLPIFKSLLARIFSTPDLEKGPPHPYMGIENATSL